MTIASLAELSLHALLMTIYIPGTLEEHKLPKHGPSGFSGKGLGLGWIWQLAGAAPGPVA